MTKFSKNQWAFGFFVAIVSAIAWFSFPHTTLSQTTSNDPLGYTLLTNIPGLPNDPTQLSLAGYLNAMFAVFLGLATVLAVLMIVVSGIQYMITVSEPNKVTARKKIENALWGLLIALGSWLLLFTINPQLIEFDLELEQIVITPPPPAGGGCATCVAIPSSIPVKSGACSGGGTCQVDTGLASKLEVLNQRLDQQNISWRVTEAWPPTVTHQNPCHQDGTCVDANFTDSSNVANVRHFIDAASDAGLTACYEVKTQEERDRLVDQYGAPPSNVKVIPQITGRHFSVYNRRTSC